MLRLIGGGDPSGDSQHSGGRKRDSRNAREVLRARRPADAQRRKRASAAKRTGALPRKEGFRGGTIMSMGSAAAAAMGGHWDVFDRVSGIIEDLMRRIQSLDPEDADRL